MKVLILVICNASDPEHVMLSDCIKETWGKTENDDVKIFYLWGEGRTEKHHHDYIYPIEEGYGSLLKKTISFLVEHNKMVFDYIFRTNLGSYVDVKRMLNHLEDKPRTWFYSGIKGDYEGFEFCSGSGFFLSKDLVDLLINKRGMLNADHIDDIALGQFFIRHHKYKIHLSAMRITKMRDGECFQIGDKEIPESEYNKEINYHWRLRSDDGTRKNDCETMHELYKKFNG